MTDEQNADAEGPKFLFEDVVGEATSKLEEGWDRTIAVTLKRVNNGFIVTVYSERIPGAEPKTQEQSMMMIVRHMGHFHGAEGGRQNDPEEHVFTRLVDALDYIRGIPGWTE